MSTNPELPPPVNDPNRARRIERSEQRRKAKTRAAKNRAAARVGLTDQPFWAWIFAGACFLIPVVTIGGIVPGAIGGGGGMAVIQIYRNDALDLTTRFWMSLMVVLACWAFFIVLMWTFLEATYG